MLSYNISIDKYTIHGREYTVDDPKGMVIICHGLGEHGGRYDAVIQPLNSLGYGCFVTDHPGHGQSSGKRGDILDYSVFLNILDETISRVRTSHPHRPIFLYGHSMGGNIALNYLLTRNPAPLSAAVITSPWLVLPAKIAPAKKFLIRIMRSVYPGFTAPNDLDLRGISHDPEVISAYEQDPLVHDKISVRLFHQTSLAAQYALDHAFQLRTPTLLMHGEQDPVTSSEGTRTFAENAGEMATFVSFPDMLHELHHENIHAALIEKVGIWLNSHSQQ